MIGLKRGTVQLCSHEKEWEEEAQKTICRLRNILGGAAKDIQHVGSTAIPAIRAKPIIDIAMAVDRFDDILVNYGLIPGIPGGDGEEQDVYILGVDHPVSEFTGRIVAIVHRENDAQDKLVAAPGAVCYSREEIERAVYFQEKYFQTRSKCCGENSTSPASVLFFDRSQIADSWLKFAVIAAKHRGKWIFCRHRRRSTVKSLGALPPEMEIAEIRLFDTLPQNLTYPAIQPDLFKKVAGL